MSCISPGTAISLCKTSACKEEVNLLFSALKCVKVKHNSKTLTNLLDFTNISEHMKKSLLFIRKLK
jgi:hypothetical protein